MLEVTPRLCRVRRRPEVVRTPGPRIDGVGKLLVIRHDRLGDLVLTLPAIEALGRAYPNARFGLVVAPRLLPLAGIVPRVDECWPLPPTADELRGLVTEFRPDIVVCISRGVRFAWAALRAGVPHRVGPGYRFYSWMFDRPVAEHRRAGAWHEAEYGLSFAHRAGAPPMGATEGLPPLALPQGAVTAAATWLAACRIDSPFVVLHPGSGGSCPRWPREHFRALAQGLRRRGHAVVLTHGPEEAPIGCDGVPGFGPDLLTLAALLDRASLVVSNSTGPVHLATALATPTLALHAPWATCGVSRWGPYGPRGWAIVAGCPGAERWSRRERQRSAAALMQGIAPEVVEAYAERLLAGQSPEP